MTDVDVVEMGPGALVLGPVAVVGNCQPYSLRLDVYTLTAG